MVDNPEVARTDNSDASSMRRLIEVTERNTPGSIGGGVALPKDEKGELPLSDPNPLYMDGSGASPKLLYPRSRDLPLPTIAGVDGEYVNLLTARGSGGVVKVAGSELRTRRDSSSSTGS